MKPDLDFFCNHFDFSLDDFTDDKINQMYAKHVKEIPKSSKKPVEVKNANTNPKTKKTGKKKATEIDV